MDWHELSDKQILDRLAARLKDHRIRKQYTQKELATKSGVSLNSVQNLEQGEMVSLRVFLPVLRALKLASNLEELVPEVSISPIQLLKQQENKRKRVKKAK